MFQNYIKIFWRSLWNNKLTSGINILGLAIGIACASMAFLFIQHERSFDRFHAGADNIYYLLTQIDASFNLSATPGAVAPALAANFPEVESSLRLVKEEVVLEHKSTIFKEEIALVESNFFDFFSFPLLSGDGKTALVNQNNIVLSETMAQKYFGSTDPIGQAITINLDSTAQLLTVSGVAANAPSYSSLQFDFLAPLSLMADYRPEVLDAVWENFNVTSLVRLRQAEDELTLADKLPTFIAKQYPPFEDDQSPSKYDYSLNQLTDYRLNGMMVANGLEAITDDSYVLILGVIALLILLVACLNFTNLSNARGIRQSQEN